MYFPWACERSLYVWMNVLGVHIYAWFYGVMVSTLDFESSDPGSIPGRTSLSHTTRFAMAIFLLRCIHSQIEGKILHSCCN